MKKRSSRRTTFDNLLGETQQPCRVWWDAQEAATYCTQSGSPVRIESPDHLQMLLEHESVVYVSNSFDQFPARLVLFEVAPDAKIELIVGVYREKIESMPNNQPKLRLYKRAFRREYDAPLARLQAAVSLLDGTDPVAAFTDTLIGQFHKDWSLPNPLAAAQLWAQIGDVFNWLGPKNLIPLDLSQSRKTFEKALSSGTKQEKKSGDSFEVVLFLFCNQRRTPRLPVDSWPLRSRVQALANRRKLRDLIPLAWAGTQDPQAHLDILFHQHKAHDFLSDPRRWLWRAVLRAGVAEANLAYLEAAFAWVLSNLHHPELFPPANPLFDQPAAACLT